MTVSRRRLPITLALLLHPAAALLLPTGRSSPRLTAAVTCTRTQPPAAVLGVGKIFVATAGAMGLWMRRFRSLEQSRDAFASINWADPPDEAMQDGCVLLGEEPGEKGCVAAEAPPCALSALHCEVGVS